ncbi:MAG: Peptidase M50 [Parcubacteria group bacterium GW2011_GWA2_40_8]|nr:MAG: Peptidase M50 [Parcubacteria group bacterium GW2011_GWA2_40_8]
MNSIAGIFIVLAILILSIILHEIAHGVAALFFGDDTAKRAGRLTLNPLPHIDLLGSIFMPLIGLLLGGFIIAWAGCRFGCQDIFIFWPSRARATHGAGGAVEYIPRYL